MNLRDRLHHFLFPSLTPKFLIRVALVALAAYIFFGHICIPLRLQGASMEPTYQDGSVNFCWRLAYLVSDPQRGDVVLVRFAGNRVMLLKRIVALAGQQVEFREGTLIVDGEPVAEPYVKYPCTWNLPPRQVQPGHVYVVGDNRSMPIEQHHFGQTPTTRIRGKILW
ncbi:signal peptidase I [candidate division KSB3 bacterium]|uniref:Signal peptidase I n=1 Tax=candidate division KSB3 bacterium TaxID=2044937 RepID=A0A9D5JW63_9BACT|nr:signal peptidase I [candidate division KSB3 bacterium]MBD3325397.1 signal peptidase I [candidate division KSB3 bacterium]